jgi:DNA polymerase I-like protein with 3'-5' exonuclease and polymerase domains
VIDALPYSQVIAADFEFEFGGNDGNIPRPVCMVAKDLRTGTTWRLWRDELSAPPFSTGPDTLFVAFYASAELGCFRALGWPMPARVLDLFTEYRQLINGVSANRSLLSALHHFGLNAMEATAKAGMIELILAGGPWSAKQRADILDYCAEDVAALERLLPAMLPNIDLPRALLRGRYMAAVSAMESAGVPIDTVTLQLLRDRWDDIKLDLIAEVDADYGVYDGTRFKHARFAEYVLQNGLPWPKLKTGKLDLKDDTFREMAKSHPIVSALRELRHALSEMRLNELIVGEDGRNRTGLGAFGSRTGRNQPGNTKFIFGPAVWMRGLIKPPAGYAIAYIDYSSQEVGIAAALSGDEMMMADFRSGDPYIAFGIGAGLMPAGAAKATHESERNAIKACVLGMQYGMGVRTLAHRINKPEHEARRLVDAHRDRYRRFWAMAEGAAACMAQGRSLRTVFGWQQRAGVDVNDRSALNFPMQANGAEMLRIACCLGTERGIEICAPVHDAVLICAPLNRIDADVEAMRAAMAEASRAVLAGFEIPTEAKIVRYPDRFMDEKRGRAMWDRVMVLVHNAAKEVA